MTDEILKVGDLVRVQLVCTIYHGIVLKITADPPVSTAALFLGNGLTVDVPVFQVDPVPLHFQSHCVANFAEILQREPPP